MAWITERLPEALVVSNSGLAVQLALHASSQVLGLPAAERDVLLQTLASWYESGRSAARAATGLYCHRNTILSRLQRSGHLSSRSLEDQTVPARLLSRGADAVAAARSTSRRTTDNVNVEGSGRERV